MDGLKAHQLPAGWQVSGRLLLAALLAATLISLVLIWVPPAALDSPAGFIQHFQRSVAADPLAAAALFLVLYVVVCALSMPGATAMTLAAGGLFGVTRGVLLVACASTIGAVTAIWVARRLLTSWIRHRYPVVSRRVDLGIGDDGPWFLFSLRLFPGMPFFLLNLLVSLTGLPLRTIAWVSALGMLPATVLYVTAGAELASAIARRQPLSWQASGALAGIALLLIAGRLVRRRLIGRS